MRKTVIPVLLSALPALCGQEHTPHTVRAVCIREIITDGDLSEWEEAEFTDVSPENGVLDTATRPFDSPFDLSFSFAAAYDSNALHIAVRTLDDRLCTDSCLPDDINAPAWDDDAVEIFIDGNCNGAADSRVRAEDGNFPELAHGGEFSITANGAAMSGFSGFPKTHGRLWHGAARVLSGTCPVSVSYEFSIPWNLISQGDSASGPHPVGFNISVQDDDDGGRRDHALYWTGNPERPFSDESMFGRIIPLPPHMESAANLQDKHADK